MKLDKSNKRIEWIDIGKGVGILLVVFGHSFRDSMRADYFLCDALYRFVYSFHMPLLMYLSGYMFRVKSEYYLKNGTKNYCVSRLHRLMKPYLIYALFIYLVITICFQIGFTARLLIVAGYKKIGVYEFLIGVLSGENPYSFHLWYIYCLTILSILGYVIWNLTYSAKRLNIREPLIWICIIGVILFSAFISEHLNSPRIISAVREMLPWYLLGCIRFTDRFSNSVKRIIGCAATLLLILYCFGILPISNGIYTFAKYPIIAGIILGITFLSQSISSKGLVYLGRNSMPIYLFHQPFIAAGSGIFFYDLLRVPISSSVILTFILSIVLPLFFYKILGRLKMVKIFF